MAFLGETSSQTIVNSRLSFIYPNGSIIHDAILYYNGKWNMPPQNKFVGCAFTGKNPKKFQIPSRCTIDELTDLIKQVAPKGIPPLGIHESQTIRRLFFCQPGRFEYSDKLIKYEINELKTNDEVLKVLLQSNYLKKIWANRNFSCLY